MLHHVHDKANLHLLALHSSSLRNSTLNFQFVERCSNFL